jgi:hypothetical protein
MRQHEAVIAALETLGGYATLGELYQKALSLPEVKWGTKTPCATIRRIVQERPEIFKIRPGLWALESHRKKLPAPLLAKKETQAKSKEVQLFDHTYYQGLLVQLGNMQDFTTYVPAQDKNRLFLGRDKLADFVSTTTMPAFTYSNITDRVKSIDVIWFNHRKLPKAVFEVEHSTDIKNSLIKFAELEEFRIEMKIVADEHRKREFEQVMASRIFNAVKPLVGFTSYQQVSTMSEMAVLKCFSTPDSSIKR